MDMLTLSHVEKHFGEKQVLRDVTFSVPEHTVFGFVGQNGAGKTTAMKLTPGTSPRRRRGDYRKRDESLLRAYSHQPFCGVSAGCAGILSLYDSL